MINEQFFNKENINVIGKIINSEGNDNVNYILDLLNTTPEVLIDFINNNFKGEIDEEIKNLLKYLEEIKNESLSITPKKLTENSEYNIDNVLMIEIIATEASITKAAAKKVLDSMINNIEKTLKEGGRVSIVGFGSWSVSKRVAREVKNPQTGKSIKIAAKKVVRFKPGAELKNAVN